MTDLAWTPKESIAIDLILHWLGESRINRTTQAYLEIELRLPTLEAASAYVNARLSKMARNGEVPYEICRFKAGDTGHFYTPFPTSLSRETIRKAIRKYRDQVALVRQLTSH